MARDGVAVLDTRLYSPNDSAGFSCKLGVVEVIYDSESERQSLLIESKGRNVERP